jgi:DNA polymerase-3 subunit alpha
VYQQRLEFEIKTILQMGFAGYFLIVADFINWAKSNGVPVGPGRGSGAGSLVAYSLGITDLDPLRYNLLFERFLNPERVSMPDFDIDFCQDGRDRVIEYVRQKYSADSVSQIVTFGTMAAKAVVRDVGRVLDLGYNFCDQIAKLIPFQPGRHITLRRRTDRNDDQTIYAREVEPLINQREAQEEEVRELLELAERLEGMTRNVGMHAGGVLIAPGKLTDFCPLYAAEGSASVVSQFDMKDVEAVGLVKFDFLGLTTLTILDWTLRYIKRLDPASTVALETIPLDDVEAYKIFSTAKTTAVFQFESRGMRDMLKQARPDRFEDIIALVALYRPGPMDLIPDFIARKHGKPFEYPEPRVESVLAETYGIMVYQEQVMQMAQLVGDYSLGGADLLRRAMGKKKPEEMAQQRGIFREGAAKSGLKEAKADELFDLMEKFAGYGFNKSHAAAYALVAYQTAYFKAHHTAAFMAANLSAAADDTDKVKQFYEDTRISGLTVLPPDVNRGEYRFVPLDTKTISYGLGSIKGTGESAIGAIVAAREKDGPFKDLFDLCERVDKRIVNRRVIEALIRGGAFDAIDDHRARLLASVGIALGAAEQAERNAQQVSLFGGADAAEHARPALVEAPRWDQRTQLKEEKVALGYYFSGHPYTAYREEIGQFVRTSLDRLSPSQGYANSAPLQTIAGVVESVRFTKAQASRMAIVTFSDGNATQEVVIYGETFDQYRSIIVEDAVLVMEVKVRNITRSGGDGEPETSFTRIAAEKIYDLSAARNKFARGVRLTCNGQSSAQKLKELLGPYRNGPCPVSIVYHNRTASCEIELGEDWRISLHDNLLQSLSAWLTEPNVTIVYS